MSWERREEGRRGQRRASWVSGASACPVEGLAWTGLCRGMNVALFQSRGRVPISAGEPMLFCQILNQEACCFLAHDSLTYLAIARHGTLSLAGLSA